MTKISVTSAGTRLSVHSPYLPAFVAAAKALGGRWAAPAWVFDARDEARVREALRTHYGTDGSAAAGPVVTLRVAMDAVYADRDAIRLGGREIARAYGRDSGAKLGDGVVLLDGKFGSGGSVKNWTTRSDGATILIRDMPAEMAERLIAAPPQWVTAIAIEPETPVVDREALAAERDRLMARVAEIDRLLAAV